MLTDKNILLATLGGRYLLFGKCFVARTSHIARLHQSWRAPICLYYVYLLLGKVVLFEFISSVLWSVRTG